MKYSFILSVRGRQTLLLHCLASIGQQSYRDFEVVVVDYGSAEPITVPDAARLIRFEEAGPWNASIAQNVGIANAKGTYLVRLDSDNILAPDLLEDVDSRLLEDDHQQIYWRRLALTEKGFWVFDACSEQVLFDLDAPKLIDLGLGEWQDLNAHGAFLVVRRDVVIELGGYDERMVGWGFYDNDLAYRLTATGFPEQWGMSLKLLHLYHGLPEPNLKGWPASRRGTWKRNARLSRVSMSKGQLVRNGGSENFDKYKSGTCAASQSLVN